jgi:pSer/pThr/pTyr-binding forkhead associated (FHA) protein
MVRMFLSYRRADSQHVTDRINDRLVDHFGPTAVFKDVDSIPLGADFFRVIQEAIAACQVFLPVIGRGWLDVTNEAGRRRLDDEQDYVRLEIEAALASELLIIPLLVDGARMPAVTQLPDSLRELTSRNAATVRSDPDFNRDLDRVIRAIEQSGLPGLPSGGAASPTLEIGSGAQAGKVYTLVKDRVVIGRALDCDVPLEENGHAARYHAQLVHTRDGYAIECLGLQNSVFVRGRLVSAGVRFLLQHRDPIQIGSVLLIYREARVPNKPE